MSHIMMLFSGETPYPGIRSHDVAAKLKRGERMRKPEHSDDV